MKKIEYILNKKFVMSDIELIINLLSKFESKFTFLLSNQKANAKSLINLLAIGVLNSLNGEFVIEGTDEKASYEALVDILEKINSEIILK